MNIKMLFTVATAATFCVAQADAEDTSAGEKIYKNVCKNCHGPKAQGMASFPRLSDKDAEYLSTRLVQYRAGEKIGPNSALMAPMAKDLSDEDIADLAGYISTGFK